MAAIQNSSGACVRIHHSAFLSGQSDTFLRVERFPSADDYHAGTNSYYDNIDAPGYSPSDPHSESEALAYLQSQPDGEFQYGTILS